MNINFGGLYTDFENGVKLSRFAGVSEAGACRRNPERTLRRISRCMVARRQTRIHASLKGCGFQVEPFCGREPAGEILSKAKDHPLKDMKATKQLDRCARLSRFAGVSAACHPEVERKRSRRAAGEILSALCEGSQDAWWRGGKLESPRLFKGCGF